MKSSKFKTTLEELIIRNARISRRKIGMLPAGRPVWPLKIKL